MTLVASAKLSDYTSLRQDELHANLVDYRHIFAKVSNDLHEKLCLAKIKADSELLIPYRNKMKVGKAMSGIFAVPEISDRERWVNGDSKLYEKSYTPRQGWDESCKKMVENGDANLIIPAMFEDESAGWEDSGKDWDY